VAADGRRLPEDFLVHQCGGGILPDASGDNCSFDSLGYPE
jgi:hypothetical protein